MFSLQLSLQKVEHDSTLCNAGCFGEQVVRHAYFVGWQSRKFLSSHMLPKLKICGLVLKCLFFFVVDWHYISLQLFPVRIKGLAIIFHWSFCDGRRASFKPRPQGPEPHCPPPPLHFSSYSKNVYLLEVWSLQIRNHPTPDPETLKSLIDSSFWYMRKRHNERWKLANVGKASKTCEFYLLFYPQKIYQIGSLVPFSWRVQTFLLLGTRC